MLDNAPLCPLSVAYCRVPHLVKIMWICPACPMTLSEYLLSGVAKMLLHKKPLSSVPATKTLRIFWSTQQKNHRKLLFISSEMTVAVSSEA